MPPSSSSSSMSSSSMIPFIVVIVLAGITSLPFIGWAFASLPVLALTSVIPLTILLFFGRRTTTAARTGRSSTRIPCHVIITGGSSGIGLAIAKQCCLPDRVKRITLMARSVSKLQSAKTELLRILQEQQQQQEATYATTASVVDIQIVPVDVTNFTEVVKALSSIMEPQDTDTDTDTTATTTVDTDTTATYLYCCAGMSHPGYFTQLSPQVFEDEIRTNYMGTVYTIKAVLPYMMSNSKRSGGGGCITITSSAAGQVGIFGYTAYAPTKFALRGLAESLHMELICANNATAKANTAPVHIQLAFPPDTDTPGYAEEQRHKPKECHLISQSGGVLSDADSIAKVMVRESLLTDHPPFTVSFGLEGWMLSTLTAGMSPISSSLLEAVTQVTLMGIFRFISLFYLVDFERIIQMCASTSTTTAEEEQKEEDNKDDDNDDDRNKTTTTVVEKKKEQ